MRILHGRGREVRKGDDNRRDFEDKENEKGMIIGEVLKIGRTKR